jgi:hypothetical protein
LIQEGKATLRAPLAQRGAVLFLSIGGFFLHDSTRKMLPARLRIASGFATSNIVETHSFGHGPGRLQAPPGRFFGGLNLRADARNFGVNWLILRRAVDVLTHHDHRRIRVRSDAMPPCSISSALGVRATGAAGLCWAKTRHDSSRRRVDRDCVGPVLLLSENRARRRPSAR